MSDQTEALDLLVLQAQALESAIDDYLDEWTSARVSHARAGTTYLVSALRKESDEVIRKARREEEKAVVKVANEERHEFTRFEVEMAAMRKARGLPGGQTPAEYRALMAEARARMGPPQSQEEVDRIMREARR
jgi:hypothetical protein